MFSFTRLATICYLLAFSFVVYLLVAPNSSQAQRFGVSTGYRATPGLPTIAIPILNFSNGGFGAVGGGGALGVGGTGGLANGSGSFSTSIMTVNLGQFFPNNGQLIGLPPPTLMPMLNNFGPQAALFGFAGLPPFLGFPSSSDSTGAPWALLLAGGGGAGGGAGGAGGAGGGLGVAGGGLAGGGGAGGFGLGQGGATGGGLGGFAGKGMGGFNGRKPL